jgi:hypothetical protein
LPDDVGEPQVIRKALQRALRRLVTLSVAVAIGTAPQNTSAAAGACVNGPCKDCLSWRPAGDDPAPLLVLLHGDGETAESIFELWQAAAARRGIIVFAPACPRSEGCASGSWWKWNGDPSWLEQEVKTLGGLRAIDATRLWILGWSGGGTYIGWNTQRFERDYAALVIHGGGVRPALSTCPVPEAGIYFLGGDKTPLHRLAEQLDAFYETTCPHAELVWIVLKGVDHEGERRALGGYREGILDWLSFRRRTPSVALSVVDSGDELRSAPPSASVPTTLGTPPRSSCLGFPGVKMTSCGAAALGFLILAAAARGRYKRRGSTPSTL